MHGFPPSYSIGLPNLATFVKRMQPEIKCSCGSVTSNTHCTNSQYKAKLSQIRPLIIKISLASLPACQRILFSPRLSCNYEHDIRLQTLHAKTRNVMEPWYAVFIQNICRQNKLNIFVWIISCLLFRIFRKVVCSLYFSIGILLLFEIHQSQSAYF